MSRFQAISGYAANDDPLAAACNRIALIVAANQPIYPLYLWALVGGEWKLSLWTWLSTPMFLAVPAVSRRNPLAGRALLPFAGLANMALTDRLMGVAAGVDLFVLPCLMIAWLALRASEWRALLALALDAALALWIGHHWPAIGHFTLAQAAAAWRLNAWSVGALSLFAGYMLINARRGADG